MNHSDWQNTQFLLDSLYMKYSIILCSRAQCSISVTAGKIQTNDYIIVLLSPAQLLACHARLIWTSTQAQVSVVHSTSSALDNDEKMHARFV